jgi:hypothetical protein
VLLQLDRASRALTAKTRSILNQMLLYDIKVVTYAVSGKVKVELAQLVRLNLILNRYKRK